MATLMGAKVNCDRHFRFGVEAKENALSIVSVDLETPPPALFTTTQRPPHESK